MQTMKRYKFALLSRLFGKGNKKNDVGFRNRLINASTPLHVLEAYRMARTNLLYTAKDSGVRVFGVTSAAAHEGKSITCANLAISFSMTGVRVLLVDCDMHRPTQNVSFGVTAQSGLSEYLTGLREEPEITETEYENVHLLCAGRCPPDPAELLQGDRFASLIMEAKTKYDCVFLDLPPLNLISDAAIIAPYLDGYVFVVRAKQSDRFDVQNAVEAIEHVEGKILGFVLNDIESRERGSNARYYGKYYYAGDREDAPLRISVEETGGDGIAAGTNGDESEQ